MRLSQEWALALLLLALYLQDAFTLAGADTAFLVRRPWLGWAARFPTVRFTLGGRHVFLPPLLPTPVFTLRWGQAGSSSPVWDVEEASAALATVSAATALSFLAVLVVTPVVLVTRQSTAIVLATMASAYMTVFVCVAALWAARRRLDISAQSCARLTAEMLLCPPVAANLIRRISQPMQMGEPFVPAARRLLGTRAWGRVRQELQARISVQLEEVEPGSAAHTGLQALQGQLQ